ncbi:MAG: hypothetical protein WCQ50_13960 [Spirochaetota bacterium]
MGELAALDLFDAWERGELPSGSGLVVASQIRPGGEGASWELFFWTGAAKIRTCEEGLSFRAPTRRNLVTLRHASPDSAEPGPGFQLRKSRTCEGFTIARPLDLDFAFVFQAGLNLKDELEFFLERTFGYDGGLSAADATSLARATVADILAMTDRGGYA